MTEKDQRDPLSRLTERAKVCLRQWLNHKSAKEIAAELGISHHAVEKRLKLARIKLGATSSLEAARMLNQVEGYGQTVTQSPDLVSTAFPPHSGFSRLAVLGVGIMILVGAIWLALFLQPATLSQAASTVSVPPSVPTAGTEAALRKLVAGLASGSPDYNALSPRFAEIVRQDIPKMQPLFSSMGELKSVTFRERGDTRCLISPHGYSRVLNTGASPIAATSGADFRQWAEDALKAGEFRNS